jgi:hypothetical protein
MDNQELVVRFPVEIRNFSFFCSPDGLCNSFSCPMIIRSYFPEGKWTGTGVDQLPPSTVKVNKTGNVTIKQQLGTFA